MGHRIWGPPDTGATGYGATGRDGREPVAHGFDRIQRLGNHVKDWVTMLKKCQIRSCAGDESG